MRCRVHPKMSHQNVAGVSSNCFSLNVMTMFTPLFQSTFLSYSTHCTQRTCSARPPRVLGWSFVHVCSWCGRGSMPCPSAAPSLGLQLILLYHSQELLWSPHYILTTMLPKFQLAWQSLSAMVNDSWIHGWLSWLHKATSSMFPMYVNRKSGFFFHVLDRQHTILCVHLPCFKATGRITNRKQTTARVASICVVC